MSNLDDDFPAQASAIRSSENSITNWMARIRFIVWAVGGLGAIIVVVAIWAFGLSSGLKTEKDERLKLETTIVKITGDIKTNAASIESAQKALELKTEADKRIYELLKTQVDSIAAEQKKREPYISKIEELWFMKDHGIGNKEDFFQKHGYQAPSVSDPSKK